MTTLELNGPFAAYLLALVFFSAQVVVAKAWLKNAGMAALWAGCLMQSAGLIMRASEAGRAPMSNMHESLLVMAWGASLLYVLMGRKLKVEGLGVWASALFLLILGAASLLDRSIRPLMPALQSNWLLYHVVVTMLGYAAFGLSAAAGAFYLFKYQSVTREQAEAWEKARAIDLLSHRTTTLGFLLLSAGIILGSVWANEAWGAYWSWDPKETWALISWFVYAIALHLWKTRGWRGTRFAWINLVGFGVVIFTYYGVNYLLSGMHSYAGK